MPPANRAIGRHFFAMEYSTADYLTGIGQKSFIAELMPPSPIYVPLLPEEAQWAIGQLHPVGELPFSILVDEGFDPDTYVDICDGGPTAHARVAMLKTVAASQEVRVDDTGAAAALSAPHRWQLAANTRREAFRAMLLPADDDARRLSLSPEAAIALGVYTGDTLRVAPLELEGEGSNVKGSNGSHEGGRHE